MKIGILSDTHGRFELARRAAAAFLAGGVERVFHCGDIGDESVVDALASLAATYVFGNVDHDRAALRRYIEALGAVAADPYAQAEAAGRRIAVIHGDNEFLLGNLIQGGRFDYVFCGHSHLPRDTRLGRTRVINPGALHRAPAHTIAILDLASDELRRVDLDMLK